MNAAAEVHAIMKKICDRHTLAMNLCKQTMLEAEYANAYPRHKQQPHLAHRQSDRDHPHICKLSVVHRRQSQSRLKCQQERQSERHGTYLIVQKTLRNLSDLLFVQKGHETDRWQATYLLRSTFSLAV